MISTIHKAQISNRSNGTNEQNSLLQQARNNIGSNVNVGANVKNNIGNKISRIRKPHIMTITSGKGGVGKTSLSVNLAIILARRGARVCLLDADTGLANINILLNIVPRFTLEHLFTGEKRIQDIVIKGPGGVDIIPGASGFTRCVELDSEQQFRLVSGLQELEPHYDYILIDTGAGISPTVLHFVAAAQVAAVVVTPEPTSLTDAFSLLKVLYKKGYKRKIQVMVNMCKGSAEAEKVFRRLNAAMNKYLNVSARFMGAVLMDESIRSSVTLQRPVALLPEVDPSCRSFCRLADNVAHLFRQPEIPTLPFSHYWKRVVARQSASREKAVNVSVKRPDTLSKPDTPPKIETHEQQWLNVRRDLTRFLKNSETTQDERVTLLTNAIYHCEGQLGNAASDILKALLQVINPDTVSLDDRRALHNLLPVSVSELKKPSEGKVIPRDYYEMPLAAPTSKSMTFSSRLARLSAEQRYDESFGSQSELAEKIRQSQGRVPLDQLLSSIKRPVV